MKIRNIIRSAATALTAALILPFAVSCGNTTAADTTAGSQTEPPPEKKSYTVIENGTSNYSIKAGRMVTQLCTKNTNLKAVILPATGEPTQPENPETGDFSLFYIAFPVLAVASLAVVAVKVNKREN